MKFIFLKKIIKLVLVREKCTLEYDKYMNTQYIVYCVQIKACHGLKASFEEEKQLFSLKAGGQASRCTGAGH